MGDFVTPFRTWLRLLGASPATGALTAWLFAPIGVVAVFVMEWSRRDLEPMTWWRFAILGQFMIVALLPLAGWVARRWVRDPVARGALTVVAMAVVVIVRGVLLYRGAALLGLVQDLNPWTFAASVIMQTGLLALVGAWVSKRTRERADLRKAAGQRDALAREEAELRMRVTEAQERVAVQVGLVIEPRRRVIDEQLAEAERSGQVQPVLDSLELLLDRDLIPLSHRLADRATPWTRAHSEVVPPAKRARELTPLRLPAGDLMRPGLVMYVVILLTFASSMVRLPWSSALGVSAFLTILIGGVLTLVRSALSRWAWPTAMALLVTPVIIGATFAFATGVVLFLASAREDRSIILNAVVGAFFGVLTALATLSDVRFAATKALLEAQIVDLQDTTSRARQALWLSRRQTGYALHGGLQAAIHAARMRLAVVDSGDQAAIASIRSELRQAFERVAALDAQPVCLATLCAEIAGNWQDICFVQWSIPDDVVAALQKDPVAAACTGEVVLETVQNAVRHGKASHVQVEAAREGGYVVLDVIDDGLWQEPQGDVTSGGLGSRMLDEFCSRWHRDAVGSGTRVRAEFALAE